MMEEKDPAKVFHAAARWYASRKKWETPAKEEFAIYDSIIALLAQEFSPEWIAREFPAEKEYDGEKYECKDYFFSMDALAKAEPFDGDEEKVQDFLWDWDNHILRCFAVAGMTLVDEIRATEGKMSMMEEWAKDNGVTTYHTEKIDGKRVIFDDKGRSLGVLRRKKPRYLNIVT
jgi:hypothetical protein